MKNNWQTKRLKEVAEYVNGRGFKKSEWSKTGKPIIRIQNLTGTGTEVNRFAGEVEPKHQIFPGDLLISWSATIDSYIYKGEDAYLNQHIFKVIPAINKKYLYYFIKYISAELKTKSHGSGMKHITKGKFENIEINVPEDDGHEVAQKLDSLFSKIDAGEEGLQQVQQQLEGYKQSVLIKLFDTTKKVKLQKVIKSIRYGTSKKSDYGLGTVPVLRIPNINVYERTLDDSDLKTSNFSEKEVRDLTLKQGDVLVIRSNGSIDLVGRSAVVSEKYAGYVFAGYLIRLEVDYSKILPEYISLALSTPFVRNQIQLRGKSTSGVNNINSHEIQDLDIPIATLEKQSQILEEIKKIESIIKHVKSAILEARKESENLRQSILKKAFNGELI